MTEYIKPRRLQVGDTIAVMSPSWNGPNVFPDVYNSGIKILKKWGLKVKEYPTTHASGNSSLENVKIRAKDINDAFADSEVVGIIPSIGGEDSVRLLPFLDKEVILKNPKIVMGYSDTVTLLTFVHQLGIVTFNGPAIMAGFAQMKNLPEAFEKHVHKILFEVNGSHKLPSYGFYTDGYADWSKQENSDKINGLVKDTGMKVIQGKGYIKGQLFGGCIEVLEFLKGTDFFPSSNFWNNKILFFETSEEKPSIDSVRRMLRNYGVQGVFGKINALLFARARGYSDDDKKELELMIKEVIVIEFGNTKLPIIVNAEFGHSDPQIVLPNGIMTQVDLDKKEIMLLENCII